MGSLWNGIQDSGSYHSSFYANRSKPGERAHGSSQLFEGVDSIAEMALDETGSSSIKGKREE